VPSVLQGGAKKWHKLEFLVGAERSSRGSTSSEPRAVATGSNTQLGSVSATLLRHVQSRSLPLPVLYLSTHWKILGAPVMSLFLLPLADHRQRESLWV